MLEEIGTRIADLRKEKGKTQQELADALGVTRSLVKAWETGARPIRCDDLVNLSRYFGVSSDFLLGLTDIKTPDFEMKNACDYTGLSEGAMQRLISMRYVARQDLSLMLENKVFQEMVSCLDDLRAAYNRCARLANLVLPMMNGVPLNDPQMVDAIHEAQISTSSDDPDFCDDALEEFTEYYSDLRIQLFELNELWSDCLESFIPTKELLADGKEVYRREIHGG